MVSIGMAVTLGSNISARWLRSYFSILQSAHNLEGVAGFDFQVSLVYWRGGDRGSQIIIIKVICKISIKFCILNDKVICQRGYFEQRLYVKIE